MKIKVKKKRINEDQIFQYYLMMQVGHLPKLIVGKWSIMGNFNVVAVKINRLTVYHGP